MLLQPKKTKYRKIQKGKLAKFNFRSNKLKFGTIGLKATKSGTKTLHLVAVLYSSEKNILHLGCKISIVL